MSSNASTTPGHWAFTLLAQLGAADRGADAPATVLGRDGPQFRDLLEIDDEPGLDQTGVHLHQQIGAAGEHPGIAVGLGQQGHGLIDRVRGLVSDRVHDYP
jgi:hypothetical protein